MTRPVVGRRALGGLLAVVAMVLVSVPLTAAPSYAVEPTGGCWVWYSGTPQRDISSKLAPWANPDTEPKGPANHTITLSPSAPPAGSKGTITYKYNKGPENAGPPAAVQGTFQFSVNGGTIVKTTVDYGTIATGQSIPGKTLNIPFTVESGQNDIVFERVTFDATAFSVKIECNGQTSGTAAKNPRSHPAPTNVKASVTSSGTATGGGTTPEPPGGLPELCIPIILPCDDPPAEDPGDGTGDDGGDDSGDGGGDDGDGGGDGGSGDEPGGGGGTAAPSGTPATGKIDFDCVLQPFNADFDYQPSVSVSGSRSTAGAGSVNIVANFGDLPGIAPVPIDGKMDVVVVSNIGGKPVTLKGSSNVSVPPESPVPVPPLTGTLATSEDTLPVTVSRFEFHFPSYTIDATCEPKSGQDLGDLKVGVGGTSAGGGAPSGGAPAAPGTPGTTTPDATTAPGEPVVTAVGAQNLSIVDVRLEGSWTVGELFGAAPHRTLVMVVQNVGTETVTNPAMSIAVGKSVSSLPAPVAVEVGTLSPNQTRRIEMPIALSAGGFGTFEVMGQVGGGEAGAFQTSWRTYPWALLLLFVVAAGIAVWGVRQRMALRQVAPVRSDSDSPRSGRSDGDDGMVDLVSLESWWQRRGNAMSRPRGMRLWPGRA